MSRYIISDIHGCSATFKSTLQQFDFSKEDELYLLGDYIDRGPDSKGVIDHIWQLQNTGHQVYCIKGNHEQMMLEGMHKKSMEFAWLRHGGRETLTSFDVDRTSKVPELYLEWMRTLPHFLEVDNYLLVHAGLNFKNSNPMEDEAGMLWARDWYHELKKDWLGDRIIVHGHTPIPQILIEAGLAKLSQLPVLNIDNGCVYDRIGHGQLCVFDMDRKTVSFVERNESGL